MCCDNCKYYIWYWDKCTKWDCIVDAREVHNCFEPISTPIKKAGIYPDDDDFCSYGKRREK